jgi:hypothetical protein
MVKILIVLLLIFALTGCSDDGDITKRISNGNNVDKVINEQIGKVAKENNPTDLEKEASSEAKHDLERQEHDTTEDISSEVDYDLTNMSSDMVYVMVYQMMVDPNAYNGKVIRMEGLYYPAYYEPTSKHYHYCIIQDALACCAQGMEFVWEDGNHVYPDEYPGENAEVVVQGTFETYRENGDDILYCRLKDATMKVINE